MSFVITHEAEEEPEEEPEEKEIKFFHHPDHKLRLVNELEYTTGSVEASCCRACTKRIAGSRGRWVYTCPETECDYGVHSACGLLATKIRHPSHPKHVLKLVKLDNPRICDVCKGYIRAGLDYQCAKCDFDMHPLCPELLGKSAFRSDHRGADEEVFGWKEGNSQEYVDSAIWMMQQSLNSQQQLGIAQQNASLQLGIAQEIASLTMESLEVE